MKTIGDHVRNRRLDLGLYQKQVAKHIGVDKTCVHNWECNATTPALRYLPTTIFFLGYNPLPEATTLAEQLVALRASRGLRRLVAARLIGVDESTQARWERGERQPAPKYLDRIKRVLQSVPL